MMMPASDPLIRMSSFTLGRGFDLGFIGLVIEFRDIARHLRAIRESPFLVFSVARTEHGNLL